MAEIISREDAQAKSLTRYFTGVPCTRGHVAERYTRLGVCCECSKTRSTIYMRERIASDPEFADRMKDARDRHEKTEHRQAKKRETTNAWRKRNPEKVAQQNKRWREKNPDWHTGPTRAAWMKLNRERLTAKLRAYRESNREKVQQAIRNWREKNPDKARAAQAAVKHRRRAREREIDGPNFSAKDIALLYREQGGSCAGCGTHDPRLEIDHVVAIAKGGTNAPSNLQLLCRSCNSSKGARDLVEWLHDKFPIR